MCFRAPQHGDVWVEWRYNFAYLSSAIDVGERSGSRPALPNLGEIVANCNL